jgi:hypothetical protein
MLHIVNGDSVANKLRQGKVQGDILVWREIYTAGPVFRDMDEPGNRAVRAAYLEQALGIPQAMYLASLDEQTRCLQQFRKHADIVLWFEHDLFDQTMLAYLLHWFARQQPLDGTALHLLVIGSYPGIEPFRGLGQLTAEQLASLAGTWQPIGQRELEAGTRIWEAYSSPDAQHHLKLLQEERGALSALPYAQEAFEAHLSRLPASRSGIGNVEQATLECLTAAGGASAPFELFRQVSDRLHVLGLGDLEYWHRLSRMASGAYPLVRVKDKAAAWVTYPSFSDPAPAFRDCTVAVTDLGRRVLAGAADWAAMQAIEDWVGGLRLQEHSPLWRWDDVHKTVVR